MRTAQRLPALIALTVVTPLVTRAQATAPGPGQEVVKTITCSSDGSKVYCDANTHHGVHVAKQRSEAPCTKGATWDYDGLGIWVDKGCSADFALGEAVPAGKTVHCSSDDGKRHSCPVEDAQATVALLKQSGSAPCSKGTTWDYDGEAIGVEQGCSADFVVHAATGEKSSGDQTCLKAVGKQRSDQMVKQCLQVSPATHPPCNAQNSCELITDEIRRSCAMLGRDAPGFCGGYK
jgi:hypothetical protein